MSEVQLGSEGSNLCISSCRTEYQTIIVSLPERSEAVLVETAIAGDSVTRPVCHDCSLSVVP